MKFLREEVISLIGERSGKLVLSFTGELKDKTPLERLGRVTVKS